MLNKETIQKLNNVPTPFYYYDVALLQQTLDKINKEAGKYNFQVHYALKANANSKILQLIKNAGLGADCVSGNEVKAAIENGFNPQKIVFAGVGKSDEEIIYALKKAIFCFNCESIQEIEVINELAEKNNCKAYIALRINPNVNANTHHYITTGLEENKFGINIWELESITEKLSTLSNIQLIGLHFHIGSQINDLLPFKSLCLKVNELQKWFEQRKIHIKHINVGGGLGINYHEPDKEAIPDFESYFKLFNDFLEIRPHQQVHFELGRAIVAQSGTLFSKVLYIKNGIKTNFAILDAGMTELIRPALYQAFHKIENVNSDKAPKSYDVVGPICESSDCFGKAVLLPETQRSDLIAIRSAGAYGEVMASAYNLRNKVKAIYSDEI